MFLGQLFHWNKKKSFVNRRLHNVAIINWLWWDIKWEKSNHSHIASMIEVLSRQIRRLSFLLHFASNCYKYVDRVCRGGSHRPKSCVSIYPHLLGIYGIVKFAVFTRHLPVFTDVLGVYIYPHLFSACDIIYPSFLIGVCQQFASGNTSFSPVFICIAHYTVKHKTRSNLKWWVMLYELTYNYWLNLFQWKVCSSTTIRKLNSAPLVYGILFPKVYLHQIINFFYSLCFWTTIIHHNINWYSLITCWSIQQKTLMPVACIGLMSTTHSQRDNMLVANQQKKIVPFNSAKNFFYVV